MYNIYVDMCHMTLQCDPSEGVYYDLACRGHQNNPSSCCLLKPYQLGLVKVLELMDIFLLNRFRILSIATWKKSRTTTHFESKHT